MPNITPIFSRVGDIQGGTLILNVENSYQGTGANNYVIYTADPTNGGFVQRLRFKGLGTNPATVMRIYINNGNGSLVTTTSAPQTPTATISASGTTMIPATYFAKIQALDAFGQPGVFSAEISNTVPATGNSIVWGWSAPATVTQGVSLYRIAVGLAAGQEQAWFTSNTTSFTQTVPFVVGQMCGITSNSSATFSAPSTINNTLWGEISLPATTASSTNASVDYDYPLNLALPPGYRIIVGSSVVSANGWIVSAVAGKY